MTIGEFVDSLVHDIERAGLEDIVIVGHSLGGMTLAGVVTKLGAARVREMIFAAAFLPSQGTSIWRLTVATCDGRPALCKGRRAT